MKILIYGAGVQGTYLAHALATNKNNEISLLARGKTAENLREKGYHSTLFPKKNDCR